MHRLTSVLAGFFVGAVSCTFAQQPTTNPQTPEDAFATRELVAWSSLQKPQPAPQPAPPRDNAIPQPDQPRDQQAKPPADPETEQSPAHAFTGKIIKDGAEYVLRAGGNTTYRLDQQAGLERYENQNVRVTGEVDTGTNRIHVIRVELLS